MSFKVGWYKRNEDGQRVDIHFELIRTNMSWKLRTARFENRETFEPQEEDWDALFEAMERNQARGKITPQDALLVKRIRKNGHA